MEPKNQLTGIPPEAKKRLQLIKQHHQEKLTNTKNNEKDILVKHAIFK